VEAVGRLGQAGAVSMIYGAGGGLSAPGGQLFTQNSPGVPGTAEAFDRFGGVDFTAGSAPAAVAGGPPDPVNPAARPPQGARCRSNVIPVRDVTEPTAASTGTSSLYMGWRQLPPSLGVPAPIAPVPRGRASGGGR
jgi:hypothetical protein